MVHSAPMHDRHFLRNILVLLATVAFVPVCGGDDEGDDDGSMDGPNDGGDAPSDDGSGGTAPADGAEAPADDGQMSECSQPGDCDVVVCECPDGPVNFSGCNVVNDIGICATAQTCCTDFDACAGDSAGDSSSGG